MGATFVVASRLHAFEKRTVLPLCSTGDSKSYHGS